MGTAVVDRVCPHCSRMESLGVSHKRVCHCTHHHADHNFAGGCKVKGCLCDRYNQQEARVVARPVKVVKPKEEYQAQEIDPVLADKIKRDQNLHAEFVAGQKRVSELMAKKNKLEADMSHSTH